MIEEQNMKKEGCFLAFEGIDGSGKTTQMQMLAERLKAMGITYYTTMEPSQGPVGSLLRQILTGRMRMDSRAAAALFAADRLDHLLNDTDGIVRKVQEGIHVLTDRYYFSNYAYQAVDMPMEHVMELNRQSSGLLKPTWNIFVDIDADTAMERIRQNRARQELYEKKSRLIKVRENYLKAFRALEDTERVIVVDGTGTPAEVAAEIWSRVKGCFPEV